MSVMIIQVRPDAPPEAKKGLKKSIDQMYKFVEEMATIGKPAIITITNAEWYDIWVEPGNLLQPERKTLTDQAGQIYEQVKINLSTL